MTAHKKATLPAQDDHLGNTASTYQDHEDAKLSPAQDQSVTVKRQILEELLSWQISRYCTFDNRRSSELVDCGLIISDNLREGCR